jgi:hypothetical protein
VDDGPQDTDTKISELCLINIDMDFAVLGTGAEDSEDDTTEEAMTDREVALATVSDGFVAAELTVNPGDDPDVQELRGSARSAG